MISGFTLDWVCMVWQLQTAKQKLSELVDRAVAEGPQVISRHGSETAVVVSVRDYRKLTADDGSRATSSRARPWRVSISTGHTTFHALPI